MEPLKHLSCAERMLRSQSPSPYLEVPLEAAPSWCWAASLSRASAPGVGSEVLPARCPRTRRRRERGGGRGAGGIDLRESGEAEASGRAGAWRGPSLPPRSLPPGQAQALPGARRGGTSSCAAPQGPRTGSPRRARGGPVRGPAVKRGEGAQRRPAAAFERHGLRPGRCPEGPPAVASTRAARLTLRAVRRPGSPCRPLKRDVRAGPATTLGASSPGPSERAATAVSRKPKKSPQTLPEGGPG